ncbi:MAG TPA: tetratricopeptide repeat protein [Bacteroidales bacterium]|nr:tetratricopeptide repeat protein [Bacteroidales bacterium]
MNDKTKIFSGLSIIPILFFLFIFSSSSGQIPFTDKELGSEFNRAMELFNKEKYPAAIRLFDSYLKDDRNTDRLVRAEAEYFAALSAVRVFNADAEYRMLTYIFNHPESPRLNIAKLELADYFYQNKNYRRAAIYYQQTNRQELEGEKLAEYFFRYGYSLYSTGDNEKALLMFSEIKDIDTEYTSPALYYFSHIAYEQKMYETALDGFMKLKEDETFGRVVPFYIVQILYIKKDYDAILEMAPSLLNSAGKERAVELYRFIGDAYYNKGQYAEALPYLEKYAAGAKASEREDKFQLGYCYYKTGDLDKAIKVLQDINARGDALSQNIWNILGDSYMKKGDKQRARFAFGEASKLDFDKIIKEESLFNYAKLTYETSNSPFGEAIGSFQEYIDQFPGSPRIQEAYDYLVGTYTQLKNYRAALASLDKIAKKDARLEAAYQRVAFFRGLELFKNNQFGEAVDMFDKSLTYKNYNRNLMSRAVYWRAESFYRLGQYENAIKDYEFFTGLPGAGLLPESTLVRYNLGSAYFNIQDYTNALSNLRAFDENATKVSPEVLADAKNRIADCYYISTDYKTAISYYEKVIDYGFKDADYAMFQKGFSLGLMNDQKGKVSTLSSLAQKYPSSSLVPNAIFERGRAYVVLEDFKRGESDFNTVISSYPNSPYVPRAIVQLGLLYYNLGENEKAVAQYKKVIENYRSTPEARYAMTGLRNAYVDMNDVNAYFAYVKTLDGYGDINTAAKDSMLYTSGENLYMTGKYDRAKEAFTSYLAEFPNGVFRQNAQFYLAESLRAGGNGDEALKLYTEVLAQPNNEFTEQTLIAAAGMLFEREEYEKAFEYYERLETAATKDENRLAALRGQLRSASEAGDAKKTIAAAAKISAASGVPDELQREATFLNARANYSLSNFDEALKDFRKVATEVTSEKGAESKYMVAEILYRNGQAAESEKVVQEFINQNTPHQYWMARIFLLLSDLSLKKGDTLQARATLQSLKDYYSVDDDGIIDEVKGKLDSLAVENK